MSKIAMMIGERLRSYRLQAGHTQESLAEKANLHATYIGQVERGVKHATLESIEKIALALRLSSIYSIYQHEKISMVFLCFNPYLGIFL